MKSFCFYQNKGGTGKTTLSGATAVQIATKEKKVIMIDGDGQGNLSSQYLPKGFNLELADALNGDAHLTDVIKPTLYKNLYILPTKKIDKGGKLAEWVTTKAGKLENRKIIKNLLKVLESLKFDVVIWDFPPHYDEFTKLILLASDEVIPVIKLDPFSIDGLAAFFVNLEELKDGDAKPNFNKIIINARDKRIALQNQLMNELELPHIKKYIVPTDTAFSYSQSQKLAVQSVDMKKETYDVIDNFAKDLVKELEDA